MFQIGEEDFSFGDDEDFWSQALEMEEAISASSTSKPVSTIRTSGSHVSHIQQTNQGSPATENAVGPRNRERSAMTTSAGNVGSRETTFKTLQDTNKQIPQPTSSTTHVKRKFAFKQKSPTGGTGSNILSATNQVAVNVNKRAKQDNQVHSSFSNSNLSIQNEKSPDLSKNIQTPNQSFSSLRAPANQISGALRPKQQLSNPANVSEKQGQQTKEEITAPFQHGTNSSLPHKTGQSTFGQDKSSGQNPATSNTKLNVPGQYPDSTAGKGLSFDVGYNLEEEFNLSQDNFDWDPVTTPSSAIITSTVTQSSVSALRSCNQLNRVEGHKSANNSKSSTGMATSTSSVVGSMSGYSASKQNVQSSGPNPSGTANQQKSNLMQGGTTSSTGRVNNSHVPHSGQVSSSVRASPRYSSSKPGQSPSNSFTYNPTGSGFQPRTPSPVCSYPANRPGAQYPQRGSNMMRPGTPGYTSSLPNSHGRGTPQGTSTIRQTPNCSTSNSTPRQFSTTPAQRFSNSSTPNHQSRTQGDRPFTTHGARTQNRGPTTQTVTPQTPLLTSRVAQLFQTPTAGSTGPSRTRVRKFPGPAGVLPKLVQGQNLNEVKLPSPENDPETPGTSSDKPEELAASQDIGDTDFSCGAWQIMKTDLGLEDDDPNSILSKNNIALVLRKASLKQLTKNRVPHLCVLIKAITFNGDSSVVLRDPTGEMQGTIHKRLVEEHQGELKPGSVLVLRQVGVLSPSLRNHYLNITPSNLVQVYPSESSTLSQSRQRTPRSSRRSSGDALLLDADLNTPRKSGSLEPSRKFSRNALPQRMDQDGLKTSKSLEKERPESGHFLRRASSIRDEETLLDESLIQRPGCSKSNNLSESLGRRISELDGGDGRDIVPNRSEARLDRVTAHSDTDHSISGKSAGLGGGTSSSSKPRSRNDNNISCPVVISDVSNRELNSKETLSNEKASAKDEDFTELLADIGDDFFDDF